jgi:hypothetical protein
MTPNEIKNLQRRQRAAAQRSEYWAGVAAREQAQLDAIKADPNSLLNHKVTIKLEGNSEIIARLKAKHASPDQEGLTMPRQSHLGQFGRHAFDIVRTEPVYVQTTVERRRITVRRSLAVYAGEIILSIMVVLGGMGLAATIFSHAQATQAVAVAPVVPVFAPVTPIAPQHAHVAAPAVSTPAPTPAPTPAALPITGGCPTEDGCR